MDEEDEVYIDITEYYSDLKKNESLPSVTTWMNTESIMLGEINQRETNTNIVKISLTRGI